MKYIVSYFYSICYLSEYKELASLFYLQWGSLDPDLLALLNHMREVKNPGFSIYQVWTTQMVSMKE